MDRVSVEEAAAVLGIKEESVRKRVSRGKLRADKDPDGRLLVWVDASVTGTGTVRDASVTDGEELLAAKDETISILRDQLRVRAEEIQRRDVIISQLTQATSNLTDRLRELEAPNGHEEASETPGPAPEGYEPRSDGGGAQEAAGETRPRSWWRRMLGG